MGNLFSARAQKIVHVYAQEECKKYGNQWVLPEHLMLALIKTGDGMAFATLRSLKINTIELQATLEKALENFLNAVEAVCNRRLMTLLDSAMIEARSLKKEYVGTEHLLIAAIKEDSSATFKFFAKKGISANDVRQRILELQTGEQSIANASINSAFSKTPFSSYKSEPKNEPFMQKRDDSERRFRTNPVAQTARPGSNADGILHEYSRDITAKAREGQLDPVVGREKEIERVIQILSRRSKNNPVLVGEPGVGKTAIVEGLATRIVKEQVPRNLLKKQVLSLDLASVIAGTKYRGEFEERLKRIMKELAGNKQYILFIDELHTIIGAGGAEGAMDAANMLKPALSRGEIQCIGATTTKEYRKHFEKDAALERRFQMVQVEQTSGSQTEEILRGIQAQYEAFHGVRYADDVIEAVVRFSERFITERFLPDKAIDILDEAGAMKKIATDTRPDELYELEEKITALNAEKNQLVQNQQFERAAEVRDAVRELRNQLDAIRLEWERSSSKQEALVTVNDVKTVIARVTGIPQEQLDASESSKLLCMEEELHKNIIGQNEAVNLISSAVRRSRAGVSSFDRPLGSFIFLGPTGVGKTLLAKTLANFLFGTSDALVRVDMSDFMEKHNSSRLVGAPPGYVGYEEGGILTERIRRNPYSVVLLDEIEKAHPDVFNLLLQVLEEGELKDNLGHTVNFRNTVIIMTSNAGVRNISNEKRLGFFKDGKGIMAYDEIKSSAMNELKRILSPELLNRIDDVVVFEPLNKKEVDEILSIQLNELLSRLKEKNINLVVKKRARSYLVEKGYEPEFGARPMRRLLQKEIEDPIATALIASKLCIGGTVTVDVKLGKDANLLDANGSAQNFYNAENFDGAKLVLSFKNKKTSCAKKTVQNAKDFTNDDNSILHKDLSSEENKKQDEELKKEMPVSAL